LIEDFLFLVRNFLELLKGAVDFIIIKVIPDLFQPCPERMPAGVFSQYKLGLVKTDSFRRYDLICCFLFQETVLMNT
jgi:hypothetical protein